MQIKYFEMFKGGKKKGRFLEREEFQILKENGGNHKEGQCMSLKQKNSNTPK